MSGSVPTTDKETLEIVKVSNVLIFEVLHQTVDTEGRQSIELASGGAALLFQGGGVREIEWSSPSGLLVPTADGQPIKLMAGET